MYIDNTELTIKIESFGAIKLQLPQSLILRCPVNTSVKVVLEMLIELYPQASDLIERCACAIEDDLIGRQTKLVNNITLVLLSPVAGG